MDRQYTKEELAQLHTTLYEILEEIDRVCSENGIQYFLLGGSAIGAHFWEGIIPWDDDIDIGMTRDNYNRFLKEAASVLRPGYTLTWYGTDPHTPMYFAKVRKDNTVFLEEYCQNIQMHHGIYVDVFPLDKVPDNRLLQHVQRKAVRRLTECFTSKDVWTWKYCGHCEIETPNPKSFLECMLMRIVVALVPKRVIYRTLCRMQGLFNKSRKAHCYNIVAMPADHIPMEDIEHLQQKKFGPLMAAAPSNLEPYLQHHYPGLQKYPPKEEQVNHAPVRLVFNTRDSEPSTQDGAED